MIFALDQYAVNGRTHYLKTEGPRERLQRSGIAALSDAELLAIIISTGTSGADALLCATELLGRFGSLKSLKFRAIAEISEVRGIGAAKAARIAAALELAMRLRQPEATSGSLRSSREVFERYRHLSLLERENFMALLLNSKNRVTRELKIAEGTTSSCVISTRDIFSSLLREDAQQVIFLHNHPSGDPEPSAEDRQITKRLYDAGNIIGIPVLDHIIIGANNHYSMRDNGLLHSAAI
ncbi:MAG: DNA repair protein RadC [Deltaproteobacteria bacterium]|nr:DNA repair protein RadC [Deltaproteobacteria bacterium]